MKMAEAYAPMLSKASKEEVALQTLKLLRAKLGRLRAVKGRGEFAKGEIEDAVELIDECVSKLRGSP